MLGFTFIDMILNEYIKKALFYISAPSCVYCKERLDIDDRALCKTCLKIYKAHKTRSCSKCAHITCECSCAQKYLSDHSVKRHIKLFRYMLRDEAQPGKHLIYSLKRDNRRDVLDFIAEELSIACLKSIDLSDKTKYIITNVPRRKNAILNYGFDHTAVLARRLSKLLDIEFMPLLVSKGRKAQKETVGKERLRNVKVDYSSAAENINLKGRVVLVVDDLVTTGASITSSSMLVRGLGAKECIAVTIAFAHSDDFEFK